MTAERIQRNCAAPPHRARAHWHPHACTLHAGIDALHWPVCVRLCSAEIVRELFCANLPYSGAIKPQPKAASAFNRGQQPERPFILLPPARTQQARTAQPRSLWRRHMKREPAQLNGMAELCCPRHSEAGTGRRGWLPAKRARLMLPRSVVVAGWRRDA